MKFLSTPLVLLALLFPSALLAEKEVSAVLPDHQVTTAEYAVFLNAIASIDPHGLYEEKMGCIVRSRMPGHYAYSPTAATSTSTCNLNSCEAAQSYHYNVVPGKEDCAISFVSQENAVRYCDWKNNEEEAIFYLPSLFFCAGRCDPALASTSTFNFNSRVDSSSLAQCWPWNSEHGISWGTICGGLALFRMASSEVPRGAGTVEEIDQRGSLNPSLLRDNTLRTARPEQESTRALEAFSNFHNVAATVAHAKKLQDERLRIASELERVGTPSSHLGEAGRRMFYGTARSLLIAGGAAGIGWLFWSSTHDFAVDFVTTLGGPYFQPYAEPIGLAAVAGTLAPLAFPATRRVLAPLGTLVSSQLTRAATDFREVPAAMNRFWEARSAHKNLTPELVEDRAREMKLYEDFSSYASSSFQFPQKLQPLKTVAEAHCCVETSFLRKNHLRRNQLTFDQTAQILKKANAFADYLVKKDPQDLFYDPPALLEEYNKKEALAANRRVIRGAYFERFLSHYKNIASTPKKLLPVRLAARAHLLMEKSDRSDQIYNAALEDFKTVGEYIYGQTIMDYALKKHQKIVQKNDDSFIRYRADQAIITAEGIKKGVDNFPQSSNPTTEQRNITRDHVIRNEDLQQKSEAIADYQKLLTLIDSEDPLNETWREARTKAFQCAGHTTMVLAELGLWFCFPDLTSYVGPQLNLILNLAAPFFVEPIIARISSLGHRGMTAIHAALPVSAQESLARAREHFSFFDQFTLPAGQEENEEASMKARALKIRSTFLEASQAINRYYQIKAAQRQVEITRDR